MTNEQLTTLLSFYKNELNGNHDLHALKSAITDATLQMDREYVSGIDTACTRKFIGELKQLLYR